MKHMQYQPLEVAPLSIFLPPSSTTSHSSRESPIATPAPMKVGASDFNQRGGP